ncbi:hypothetical protein BKH31_09720 [Actinomyces oris]|uniref:Integrase catalytic domain-containing protein n=2 Tax=Actinomyces oris TaxID=544580 RepID=A0A1Q8VAS7_9ACTO|nr:hypothetical protein BKH31_09720 [Actinomyces oris]
MSVEEFCAQVGISRASFYRIRRRAEHEGLAAALTPRPRAPHRPARVWDQGTDERIAQVRADLLAVGREAGPASVWWVMSQGASVPAPWRATIARSLCRAGLVVPAPRKRPRTSYKRFTRSAANEMWQIDGFQWRLEDRLVAVYQVVDDCSRVITALRACWGGENVAGTRMVLEEAFTTWGRPAAILSDNALAFNTSRTTGPGATEKWPASLGVRPISGRVGHPQTRGKVERSHQPAVAWLRAHPASTLEELNTELDRFTSYYNTERQHQGHGVALTPLRVWTQAPGALASPAPIDLDHLPAGSGPISLPDPTDPAGSDSAVDRARRTVMSNGCVSYKDRALSPGKAMHGIEVTLIEYLTRLDLYDPDGRRFVSLPWPQPTQRQ